MNGVVAFSLALFTLAAEPVLLDGVAAIIGRRVITRAEVDTEGHIVLINRAGARGDGRTLDDTFRKTVLDYLVVQELLLDDARRQQGLVVPESDVDRGVATFKGHFGGDEAFAAFLQRTGADEETVRTIVRRDLTVQRLLARVLDLPLPTSDETRQYQLAHPELLPDAADAARTRAASDILLKARREARFEEYMAELKRATQVRVVARYGDAAADLKASPSANAQELP